MCDTAPAELPLGVSPDCQDMAFTQSAAATRPGLTSIFAAIAGNPTVNYLKTYEKLDGTLRMLAWDSAGNLWVENAVGVLTSIASALYTQSAYANSTTIVGKEYLAFGDGKIGQDVPRQYDDTNLDRYTQSGPGVPPVANDNTYTMPIVASPAGIQQYASVVISNLSEVGSLVTATVPIQNGLQVGDTIVVAGVVPAGYNGTWKVAAILQSGQQIQYVNTNLGLGPSTVNGTIQAYLYTVTGTTGLFTNWVLGGKVAISGAGVAGFNATWTIRFVFNSGAIAINTQMNLANSGNGTAAPVGNITAGARGVAVAFQLRSGTITKPSPMGTWTAAGSLQAVATGIPTGPPNTVARIVLFTIAGGATYFYIPAAAATPSALSMVIPDNVTQTLLVDFTDAALQGATNGQYLFTQIELPEVMGVIDYSQRLFWWGERNTQKNFLNLDFLGGSVDGTHPSGWTVDQTNGAGGDIFAPFPYYSVGYEIIGDGATATRGLIYQSAFEDYLNVPIITPNVAYSARVRLRMTGVLTQGTLHVRLFSASGLATGLTAGVAVAFNQITAGAYTEFTAALSNGGVVPSDLVLQIYADGTPTNAAGFMVGPVEIYPTKTPTNPSAVRASTASNVEQIDGVTGFFNVAENNGQAIRAGAKLRGKLYFAKEHSLHSTEDNGQEPNNWTITQVSAKVGTPSVRGMANGEDWIVIADRAGLYIFNGGEPVKISQEVGHSASGLTLAWDQINWKFGHTLWVAVDTVERRILVGAPFGAATSPNFILQMDYRDVEGGAEGIAQAPPIIISYRGMKIVRDKSRKWSPWTISANHGAVIERFDGTQQIFLGAGGFGNQATTGKIYQVDQTNLTDDGKVIPSYYVTAFTPQRETEQMLQLHAHRKLFYYLSMYCEGAGYMNVTALPENENNSQLVAQVRLTNPAMRDLEATINVLGERVAFKVAPDATVAGNWFRLQKFCPSMNGDPWSPVRGQN